MKKGSLASHNGDNSRCVLQLKDAVTGNRIAPSATDVGSDCAAPSAAGLARVARRVEPGRGRALARARRTSGSRRVSCRERPARVSHVRSRLKRRPLRVIFATAQAFLDQASLSSRRTPWHDLFDGGYFQPGDANLSDDLLEHAPRVCISTWRSDASSRAYRRSASRYVASLIKTHRSVLNLNAGGASTMRLGECLSYGVMVIVLVGAGGAAGAPPCAVSLRAAPAATRRMVARLRSRRSRRCSRPDPVYP